MLQIVLTLILYLLLLIPVGNYVYRIAAGKHTFADPVMDRVDHAIYKLCGVNPGRSMDWKRYAGTLVGTNLVMILLGYLILRLQSLLFLNPNAVSYTHLHYQELRASKQYLYRRIQRGSGCIRRQYRIHRGTFPYPKGFRERELYAFCSLPDRPGRQCHGLPTGTCGDAAGTGTWTSAVSTV